jgi:hypothetical protein
MSRRSPADNLVLFEEGWEPDTEIMGAAAELVEDQTTGLVGSRAATSDEFRAEEFLFGWIECGASGLWGRKYFTDKRSEDAARKALVRLLRTDQRPLNRTIRYQLAALFDDNCAVPRKLVFKRRHKRQQLTNYHVRVFVEQRLRRHQKMEAAVTDAVQQFGISRKEVYRRLRASKIAT